MEFSRQEYWSGLPFPSPGDLPNPEIKPRSPALQARSLPFEPPGKPKNSGVGSLSLLQGLFLIQESNWGLLHCRRILSQLSYQGSSHQLSILYMVSIEYMCQSQSPSSSHPSFPFGIHIFVLYICVPISALQIEKNFLYHILMHICGI